MGARVVPRLAGQDEAQARRAGVVGVCGAVLAAHLDRVHGEEDCGGFCILCGEVEEER